jgi:pilus assembly protein FimV
MLVSLLRANPDAFIGGNVNRLKAGAVLELPNEAEAAAVGAAQARQTVIAQSKDFNEFKQRLAAGVTERPATGGAAPPGRATTGQVQARVEEKKPAPATPDRLTLSKGAIEERARDGKASEDRIARERAEREAATRAAELDRNIAELKRLGSESATLATPASAAAASAASSASANPAGIPVPATLPAPGAAAGTASAAAAPATDDNRLMDLLANPMLPAAVGVLLALLLGVALYRQQQVRRAPAGFETDAAGDKLAPDSFFGGSGGQRIDTSEAGNSMLYSPSQIDAAGDVDPVAEADVYLAYGRDLQAEEILREALQATPQRLAIHAKLLEILARRHDVDAFEAIARDAHALTGGSGPHWTQIASQGLELDPGNPLYSGAGVPAPADMSRASTSPAMAQSPQPAPVPAPALPEGLDLDVASFRPRPTPPPAAEAAGSPFDFSDLEPGPAPAAKADSNALDFDLAGLSLDLQDPASSEPGSAGADALATKLSLAEEFHAIGDVDGARSLVQEVLAEADGDLRGRAQRLLAELG